MRLGAPVEIGERLPPLRRQYDFDLAPVTGRGLARDEATLLQALQQARELARVDVEVLHQLAGRQQLALGKFVQHPRLRQREAGVQMLWLDDADLTGEEAGETAH